MNASNFSSNFFLNSSSLSSGVSGLKGCFCRFIDIVDFFFVAHPESGRSEGRESERVLYFYTNGEKDLVKQTQITGFAEAVVNFTENFSDATDGTEADEYPHRFVSTGKHTHVYIPLESAKFILGIGINKESCATQDYVLRSAAVKSVLIMAYKMFQLFFGTFHRLLLNDPALLRDRLEYFFSRYFTLLRLQRMPILDMFPGVNYLALESKIFLRIENFHDELVERFPQFSKTMFLYHERLVTYSVSKSDLPVLFQYLTHNLLNKSLKAELQPSQLQQKESKHGGKFLTGSYQSLATFKNSAKLPVVYLTDDEERHGLIPYELIVYRALNATICMFTQKDVDSQFLKKLDEVLGPELSVLASSIGDSLNNTKNEKREIEFHFVYYNPETLSLKTSFYEGGEYSRLTTLSLPPSSVYRTACDTFDEFLKADDFGEVSVKLDSDWWMSAKKVNKRILLIMLLNPAISSLTDLQQLINNIIKENFDTMFLI